MKLYQALKLKNKLALEIKEAKELIVSYNRRIKNSSLEVNVEEVYENMLLTEAELIVLKTKINKANLSIQSKIFEIAELKGLLKSVKDISTSDFDNLSSRWGESTSAEYEVTIDFKSKQQKIFMLKSKIESIQEDLDHFNHTTDI